MIHVFLCLSDARDRGSIHGLGRSSGEGNGNPVSYSCLGDPMDRGAWQATVHGGAKSWTLTEQLSTAHVLIDILIQRASLVP